MKKSAILLATLAALFVSACGADTVPTAAPSTSPAPTSVPVPEALRGGTTLDAVEMASGSRIVGTVEVQPGELWLDVDCLGTGSMVVKFEPMDEFTLPCLADRLSPTRNQINLTSPHTLKLTVSAPDTIKWSMRVQTSKS